MRSGTHLGPRCSKCCSLSKHWFSTRSHIITSLDWLVLRPPSGGHVPTTRTSFLLLAAPPFICFGGLPSTLKHLSVPIFASARFGFSRHAATTRMGARGLAITLFHDLLEDSTAFVFGMLTLELQMFGETLQRSSILSKCLKKPRVKRYHLLFKTP